MPKQKFEASNVAAIPDVCSNSRGDSRRDFLRGGMGILAGARVARLLLSTNAPESVGRNSEILEQLEKAKDRPILLHDGNVLSMDADVGDFARADVLIQGKKIVSVQPHLKLPTGLAIVIDASNMIVMPGFVDTHHHQYETALRSILSDGVLDNYSSVIQGIFTPAYLPEDAMVGELVASLNQINAGVTTTVDTSQVSLSPEHTDACLAGLRQSGRRAVFAYSHGIGPRTQFPQDIVRLRKQFFSSDDQLLTLALNAPGTMTQHWPLARSLSLPIVGHFIGSATNEMGALKPGMFDEGVVLQPGLMGPDIEYIHCTEISNKMWRAIADTGGRVSIAPAIEMQMKHGMPPIQAALDHGIRPSLSVDVECNMAADFFTVMRTAFTLQRALVNQRSIAGEQNVPPLLTCRDILELSTIEGAKTAHLDHKIGTLTPGKEADIIMLSTNRINVVPMNNVPGTVVTLMDTSNVENVFIAGKVAKWQGQLVGVDLHQIRRQIENSRAGLLARTDYPVELFRTCCH